LISKNRKVRLGWPAMAMVLLAGLVTGLVGCGNGG